MLSPLPRIPVSGTCDANGNASISNQIKAPSSFWAQIYVPVQVSSGTPAWSVQLGAMASASPLVFSSGQETMLGPFLLLPGELATLTVTGAAAGATVTGQALGWQSEDPAELLAVTPITTALTAPALTAPNVLLLPFRVQAINIPLGVGGTVFTFDTPEQVNAVGAILYWNISTRSAGTTDFVISQHDLNTGADLLLLDSGAIAGTGTGSMYVYPGISSVTNVSFNGVVGHTPRITCTLAGGGTHVITAFLDLLP